MVKLAPPPPPPTTAQGCMGGWGVGVALLLLQWCMVPEAKKRNNQPSLLNDTHSAHRLPLSLFTACAEQPVVSTASVFLSFFLSSTSSFFFSFLFFFFNLSLLVVILLRRDDDDELMLNVLRCNETY